MAAPSFVENPESNPFGLRRTNCYCPACGEPRHWHAESTECCRARTARAYSDVRCAFCADEREVAHWCLWSDGVTRPCACSRGRSELGHQEQPNPDRADGIAAALLACCLGWVGFAHPVPRERWVLVRSTTWYIDPPTGGDETPWGWR